MKKVLFIGFIVLFVLMGCKTQIYTPFDETVDYYASKMKESSTRIDSLKWEAAK